MELIDDQQNNDVSHRWDEEHGMRKRTIFCIWPWITGMKSKWWNEWRHLYNILWPPCPSIWSFTFHNQWYFDVGEVGGFFHFIWYLTSGVSVNSNNFPLKRLMFTFSQPTVGAFQKISFYLICAGQGAEICVDAAYSNSPKYAPSYWDSHVQMQGGKKWLGDFSQTWFTPRPSVWARAHG